MRFLLQLVDLHRGLEEGPPAMDLPFIHNGDIILPPKSMDMEN